MATNLLVTGEAAAALREAAKRQWTVPAGSAPRGRRAPPGTEPRPKRASVLCRLGSSSPSLFDDVMPTIELPANVTTLDLLSRQRSVTTLDVDSSALLKRAGGQRRGGRDTGPQPQDPAGRVSGLLQCAR